MDSTPPSSRSEPPHQSKSASRLARMVSDSNLESCRIPHFTVDFAAPTSTPPVQTTRSRITTPSSTPAKLSSTTTKPTISVPLNELLLLSPTPSPIRHSKSRLVDRMDSAEEVMNLSPIGSRRSRKLRGSSIGFLGCASPRSIRRSRRRLEVEVRDDREVAGAGDEVAKPRKKRQSTRTRKDKVNSSLSVPPPSNSPKENGLEGSTMDGIWQLMCDLAMWRDVAKSSFWFGFGCLCFLSSLLYAGLQPLHSGITSGSCFPGIFFLIQHNKPTVCPASSPVSRKANIIPNHFVCVTGLRLQLICSNGTEKVCQFNLKEDDIVRIARVVLPTLNLAIRKTSELFSGEPTMTLKVASFLLMGAKYGQLLTIWRFCALGFFTSFTVPRLYISYAAQIDLRVEQWRKRVLEMWHSCSRKKAVSVSVATAFWNLSSLKTRIFAAFFALVILRYCRQNAEEQEISLDVQLRKKNQQNASVVTEQESSVVREDDGSEKP